MKNQFGGMMKKKGIRALAFVVGLVLMVAGAFGQAATPGPTPVPDPNAGVHFVTDTAFYQMSSGKQATVFSARVPLTPKFSGVFSQWLVPPVNGNISLAGVEYRRSLADLLKNSSMNPDLKKLEIFARGQIGTEIDSDNSRNFAYGIEGGLEFPVGTVAGGVIKTGVRIGFLGLPYEGTHFVLGSQATISPQVSVSF
jgi:hypothetical protein